PAGPQMTMRSPRSTARLMSRSTWKSPNHLWTSIISTARACVGFSIFMAEAAGPTPGPGSGSVMLVSAACGSAPPRGVDPPLDELGIARHPEAEAEIDQARERESREQGRRGRPVGVGQGSAQLPE